jgi:hypothetical protein
LAQSINIHEVLVGLTKSIKHIQKHRQQYNTITSKMPLTLTITEGVLSKAQAVSAIEKLTEAFLERHNLTGNTIMTPNVTANIVFIEQGLSFSGGKAFSGVWVEWKVPSFAFATEDVQKGFGKDASDILQELTDGKQPVDNVYFNVVHTVGGAWALDGKAMTNAELGEAIGKGAPSL